LTKNKKKLLIIVGIITLLVILYRFYKIEVYTYVCEEESNAPGCYVLSKELGHIGEKSKAQRYLKISCDLKYERACKELKKGQDVK
jgi:hypothetical protein